MQLKEPVHEGSTYRVRFSNTSNGVGLVAVTWVPKRGNDVPSPREAAVAPASTGELSGVVPSNAGRMQIVGDVDGGSGKLELFEDGSLHSSGDLTDSTTWTMVVVTKP